MTAEERAKSLIGSFYEWMAAGGDYHGTPLLDRWTDAIRAAETLARSEGRREGLEEAAREAEDFDPDGGIGNLVAKRIRALADGPQTIPAAPPREE